MIDRDSRRARPAPRSALARIIAGVAAVLTTAFITSCTSARTAVHAAERNHPLVGKPGPAFSGVRVVGDGGVALSDVKGKVVVVEFWATWCAPCHEALPQLQRLGQKYDGAVAILGVSEDDEPKRIADFIDTYSPNLDVVWDYSKKIAGAWQPQGVPTTFVVDARGVVRFVHIGYADGLDIEIERELKTLL